MQHTALPTELQSDWAWRLRGTNVFFNVGRTIVFPGDEHATAIRVLAAGCSKSPSPKWPQMESDIFGFCAREKVWSRTIHTLCRGSCAHSEFKIETRS